MGIEEFIRTVEQQTIGGVSVGACAGGGGDDMPKYFGKGKWHISLLGSNLSKGAKERGKQIQRAMVAYREVRDDGTVSDWAATLQSRRTLATWNKEWEKGAVYKKDIEEHTVYYVELEEDFRNPQSWENPDNHQVTQFYPLIARVFRLEESLAK
jgi:hypothetical protein